MAVSGVEEWRQLPGGDLLAGTQAAVLGHQVTRGGKSACQDDGVVGCLDGAVIGPLMVEGKALHALPALPGDQLSGFVDPSSHEEEAQAGDCGGVVDPTVDGVSPLLPARSVEVVTAVTITCYYGVLPCVQGWVVHPPGEGRQGALQLPGGWGPELSRGGVRGASDYGKS